MRDAGCKAKLLELYCFCRESFKCEVLFSISDHSTEVLKKTKAKRRTTAPLDLIEQIKQFF